MRIHLKRLAEPEPLIIFCGAVALAATSAWRLGPRLYSVGPEDLLPLALLAADWILSAAVIYATVTLSWEAGK